jgi:hypothetical protein
MTVMDDTRHATDSPPPRTSPRRRWWLWVLVVVVVLALTGGGFVWWLTRPPAPVSVSDVVHRFRGEQSSAPAAQSGGPARGVYVYATTGGERISAGNLTHHYPARTTLSVVDTDCGMRIRWDALAGRWSQWDLCRTSDGWELKRYVDVHKFLYKQDVHRYTCSGYPVVVCKTDGGVLTSTVESLSPRHVRITQEATGGSVSTGVIEAWLLPSGLPRRVVTDNHGAQTVLGARITYTESATFTLTSTTPLR